MTTKFWVHVAGPIERGLIFVNNRPPEWYDKQATGWTHYPVLSVGTFSENSCPECGMVGVHKISCDNRGLISCGL